jgi:hypothetical protein
MEIKRFMSPVIGRRSLSGSPAVGRKRNGIPREDESHLLQSPTDCEANEIVNGNCIIDNNRISPSSQFSGPSSLPSHPYHAPDVGFCFPNKLKTPVSQVCDFITTISAHLFLSSFLFPCYRYNKLCLLLCCISEIIVITEQ